MSPGDDVPAGPVLALDTATTLGSVAVGVGDRVLAEVTLGVEVRHSESLLPAVRFVLERARVVPSDLEAVVVGAGPGSFTGVRIAGATAKGMVFALGLPLYSYSSLAGLAMAAGVVDQPVCAVFPARRDEVFAACYRFPRPGGMTTVLAPAVLPIGELVTKLADSAPLWVGEGAVRLADRIGGHGVVAPASLAIPRASALLTLVRAAPAEGRVERPAGWSPDYVRPPGAKIPV